MSPETESAVLATRVFLGTAREFHTSLEPTQENWKRLLDAAQAEGLGGFLARELARLPGWSKLVAPFQRGEFLRFVSYQALLKELSGMPIQGVLLKGAALMQSIYAGEIGLRPLGDVDLLVRPQDLRDMQGFLRERGFTQGANWARADQAVDLHTDLLNAQRVPLRRQAYRLDLKERATPGPLRIPDPCDHLLFLCVHALKHSHCRLFWLLDIGRLLPHCTLRTLEERAHESNTSRPLNYALTLLERVFHLPNPQSPRYSLLERLYLQRAAQRKPMHRTGELLTCLHLPGGHLRYLWQLARAYFRC